MTEATYFVKSLEEDFHTKTLLNAVKANFQSLIDMVKKRQIKPNTKSFGRKKRLSTTILNKNYLKTYRPQGIIFQTNEKPDYIMPFDLVLLTKADKIIVHYYRIKNNLHLYYNHELIAGYEKFIFKDFSSMITAYHSPRSAWKAVNIFRKQKGYKILPPEKYRLVEYNEAVFQKTIKIKPIAIFGYRKEARKIAKKLNLPYFVSAREFWRKAHG
jgi:hypothetical protein